MTDSSLRLTGGSPAMEDPDRLACRLMQRAWNRDGLPEIAAGLLFFGYAALIVAPRLFHRHSEAATGALAALIVLLSVSPMLAGAAVKWVRTRFLIDRTGYVEMRPVSWKRFAVIFSVAFILAGVASGVVTKTMIRNHGLPPILWIVPGTGVLIGISYVALGRSSRFAVSGGLIALTGIMLGIFRAPLQFGWIVLYGVAGTVSTISGAMVLIRSLRPAAPDGE